jgi:hypothetical protein
MSNPCDRCPPHPFIVARGGAQGEVKRVTILGRRRIPSYVVVRQGALKPSRDVLLGEPPRGRVGLFTPGRLAFLLSSLSLS